MAFADLYVKPTLADAKATVVAIAQAAGLTVTSWILGEPSERWIEIVARAIDAFGSTVTTQAVRGFFLDLATDPGDPGDLSDDQTPRAGWLSGLGAGWYGTARRDATFGTLASFTITNTGATSTSPFKPFDLTFASTAARADGGHATYRNDVAPSIYVGAGGTLTLTPGASATIPIVAEQIGTDGSAAPGQITVAVTQSFQTSGVLTCTNASALVASDREAPDLYRARCRLAADKLSPGGPTAAYKYAANTARDGSPLQRFDGSGPVTITDSYVSPDSATGLVTIYYRGPSGSVDTTDASSANANIAGTVLGVITDPLGVTPDTVLVGPTVTDPNTGGPGGASATNTSIAVTYSVKAKAGPGITSGSVTAAVNAALAAYFLSLPIGGRDPVAGAGVVYTVDILGVIYSAGVYDVIITVPAGATTAIALGHVPVLGVTSATITLV
jgi:hypothetical protein